MKGDIKELERKLKALANKRRLAILKYLKEDGRASVGDIAGEIKGLHDVVEAMDEVYRYKQ